MHRKHARNPFILAVTVIGWVTLSLACDDADFISATTTVSTGTGGRESTGSSGEGGRTSSSIGQGGSAGNRSGGGGEGGSVPPPGCFDGTTDQAYENKSIVGCDGAETQWDASAMLCANGWHMCTMDEYKEKGGLMTPATTPRWIASCVRAECGAPTEPTSSICSISETPTGASADVAYTCAGQVSESYTLCSVGVIASTELRRVGAVTAPCLRNEAAATSDQLGATCCMNEL